MTLQPGRVNDTVFAISLSHIGSYFSITDPPHPFLPDSSPHFIRINGAYSEGGKESLFSCLTIEHSVDKSGYMLY